MNDIIKKQLEAVEKADLSNYDASTNTYHIPKRKDIKVEEDSCYLIYLKDTFFANEVLKVNWNNGSVPSYRYLKIDVAKVMAKMIKVVSVAYDEKTNQDISYFWSGWLNLDDVTVIKKL